MSTTSGARAGNLPAELTSFVGRRSELDRVKQLLSESRFVTLSGAGGTGKTRLAARLAGELRRLFPDGVWLIDFTQLHARALFAQDVRDPDMLAFLVTATLGLREQGDGPPLQLLTEQLADPQMLLVLDNCEHLLPASAILADVLLRGCPRLRVLATSREPLAIAGEVIYHVPPLPTPDPDHRLSLTELSRYESVALFVARAQAAVPGFALTEDNRVAVLDLCHRLDGLPLAIELAAARARVLAPDQILDRLTDRFALLVRGSRGGPQRQQTLRACVDWSFELCAKPERLLWARLSVFIGGFELDAVEGVCADDRLPDAELLDLLSALVDKSVVVRDDVPANRGGTARYRMLETIQEYGQDKLREAGDDLDVRRRHRDWFQALAARAAGEWVSDRQAYWISRLARGHSNLRAALDFSLERPGESQAALQLVVSLPSFYWWVRGLFGEGRHWLDRTLAQSTAASPLCAVALLRNAQLAFWQGDAAAGMRRLNEGERLARQLNAAGPLAYAAFLRGLGALYANDLPTAAQTLIRARAILSQTPDADLDLYLNVLLALASAAALTGDHDRAGACHREVLAIVEPRGGGRHLFFALFVGAVLAWTRGDLRGATLQVVESLRLRQAPDQATEPDRYSVALCLELLAWIAVDQEQHRRAATLLGAADALWADSGASMTAFGHYLGYHRAAERLSREALGDTAFVDAFDRGQQLNYEAAIGYALGQTPPSAPSSSVDIASTPLTSRERQIAELIAEGLSNKEIAGRLVISHRTAESHVQHILTKLGFSSRAQVAAWNADHLSGDQTPDRNSPSG